MLNPDRAKMYEDSAKSRAKGNYVSSDHKRLRRGFFRVPYGAHIFTFYPARFWPAYTGLSVSGIRSLVTSGIIVMYKRHGTEIASRGELEIIRWVSEEHQVTYRQQARDNPVFISDVRHHLNIFRTHMDEIKTGRNPEFSLQVYMDCMLLNINDRNSKKE